MKPLSDGSDSAYNNHELNRFLDEMSTQDASSMQFGIDKIDFDLFGDPLTSSGASPFPVDEEMFAEEYNPFGSSDLPVPGDSDLATAADALAPNDQRQAPYVYNDLLSVPSLLDPDYSTVDLTQSDTELDDLELEQPVIEFEDLDAGIEADLEDLDAGVEADLEALNAEAGLEDLDTEVEVEADLEDLNAAVEAHLEALNAEEDLEDLDTEEVRD